jgi:carboxylate-amine ligase
LAVAIEFNASRGATLGVEWELQLVDADTKRLRQDAREVLSALPGLSQSQENPKIRHELMESTVEIVTGICDTVSDARADLAATVIDLRSVTDARNTVLACTGTHAISDWRDAVMAPVQRYAELVEQMQWLARRIQTYGVHVHVGVRSPDKAVPMVNALSAYLPHFLALTASSPFWGGHDTGLASSRAIVFGSLPTAGPPHLLADWAEFEEYMDTLLRAGTIRSIKEVWWDIRPHPDFGTIEIRMFDGIPTLREVGMAAALCQSLVTLFDQQLDRGYTLPRPAAWVVRDNKWRATRYGLDAIVITDDTGNTAQGGERRSRAGRSVRTPTRDPRRGRRPREHRHSVDHGISRGQIRQPAGGGPWRDMSPRTRRRHTAPERRERIWDNRGKG